MKLAFQLPSGLILLALTSTIQAHTWIEQLSVIASNGTFVGTPGYPRGLVARLPGVDPDAGMVWLLPPNGRSTGNAVLPSDLMCKGSQTVGTQTPGSPALIASAGDQIALRYQENGHVTQPQIPVGKPEGSGTVYVYGTEKSENTDTFLGIHNVWNTAGTGGDGRGVLLATRHFDDGQCYQKNTGAISQARMQEFPHEANSLMGGDLWCQTDVRIPATASGNYTLYWVWDWPTLDTTGKVTQNESYTTCMDVVLTPSNGNAKAEAVNFASGQNIDYAGIAAQLSTAFLVNPTAAEQTFVSGQAPAAFTGSVATVSSAAPAQSTTAEHSSVSQSQAAGAFITVTVTASAEAETVTVTKTVNGGASQATSPAAASTHTSPRAQTSTQSTEAQTSTTSSPKAQTTTHSTEAQTSTAIVLPLPSTPASSASTSPLRSASSSSASVSQPTSSGTASPSRSASSSSASVSQPTSSGTVPAIVPFLSPASQIAKAPAQASTLSTSQTPSSTASSTSDCPDMTPGATGTPTHSRTLAPSQSAVTYLNGSLHNREFKLRGRIIRS